jgi:outer membrane protein
MVVKNPISPVLLLAAGAGVVLIQSLAAQTPAPAPQTPPAAQSGALTASGAPLKIGVIEAQLALVKTKDGQAAQAELEKKLGPKAAQIKKQQEDLNDLQRRLDTGGNTMAAATKTELQNNIASKTRNLQRDIQDFQDEQQAEENRVLADLEEKMKGVIAKYAADNGLALILNVAPENTPILWMSDSLDITQAIIDAYDKAGPAAPRAVSPAKPSTARPPAAPPKPPAVTPVKP